MEWQVDEQGHRFRYIAPGCREYEKQVTTTFGTFGESTLKGMVRPEQSEPEPAKPPAMCPFARTMRGTCVEGCSRYSEEGCGIVVGMPPRPGKRCPLPGKQICAKDCALWTLCSRERQ